MACPTFSGAEAAVLRCGRAADDEGGLRLVRLCRPQRQGQVLSSDQEKTNPSAGGVSLVGKKGSRLRGRLGPAVSFRTSGVATENGCPWRFEWFQLQRCS
jgi:hypothetical protein